MVIVTRRIVEPEVHLRAPELDVCVDTFGGSTRAIDDFVDISDCVHPEESYFRTQMSATRAVMSVIRRGHRAWGLYRVKGLRSLTVMTHEQYELTDDEFADLLDQDLKLDLDALVVTNSAAQGIGDRVVNSSQQAGVPLYTLNEFASRIRDPWT
jgi:hypothetical protein